LNVDHFYDGLVGFINHAQTQGFVRPQHAALMMVEAEPNALLQRFRGRAA